MQAFEPVEEFFDCLRKNVKEPNVFLHCYGFSDKSEFKEIQWDVNATGGASVVKSKYHRRLGAKNECVKLITLDSLSILELDFVKIDCEGYEYFILKGGEQTIRRYQPIINIEDKFDRYGLERGEALRLLESWGARLLSRYQDDCVYGWD